MKKIIFFLFFLSLPVMAGDYPNDYFFRFLSENDSYGIFTDRYYTSGNRIEFFSKDLFSIPAILSQKVFRMKPIEHCEKTGNFCTPLHTSSLSANQLLFTPYDVGTTEPRQGDRPYSGLFFISNSYSAVLENWIYYSEWKLGFTGQGTLAEKSQREIHQFFAFGKPAGWSTQEPYKNAFNVENKFIKPLNKNFAVYSNIGLGNMDLHNEWGLYLRFGKLASQHSFSGHSIRDPGQAGIYSTYPLENTDAEYYFFIYPAVRYQAQNITLESNPNFDFKGALSHPNYSEVERYAMYKFGLLSRNTELLPQQEFLLFNTIFNQFSSLDQKQARILIEYIFNSEGLDQYAILAYYNIIRPKTETEYALTKYMAYKLFLTESNIPESEHQNILFLAFLNGDFNLKRRHFVEPRKIQGIFQSGFAFKTDTFFASISWTLSSTEFHQSNTIPGYYLYGNLQLGYRF